MRSNKPHIVYIHSFIGAGGVDRLIFNLIIHPKLKNFKYSIICINPVPPNISLTN